MLANQNEYLDEATQTLYKYNSDALVREKCRARETQLFFERSDQTKIQELTEELTNMHSTLAEKDAENARLKAEIARLKAQIENQK